MKADLEKAIALAVKAHQGQRDKAGMPYVLHPLRMMLKMGCETEMIVAVLHDVVEDSEVTLDDLSDLGFAEEIIRSVDCLTKRQDESYGEFIERALADAVARKVKIADIEDNMDIRRLGPLTVKDVERLKRYQEMWGRLKECADEM
jgi:(p)ppGpp synthase/HD superfamily hydrolase